MFNFAHMDINKEIQKKIDSGSITITELSRILGITRATIYAKLKKDTWKKSERYLIKTIL